MSEGTYANPRNISKTFTGVAFGGGNSTKYFYIPKNVGNFVLRNIRAEVTTSFVGTTSPGKIQVGDGVTANKYGEVDFGTAGAGTPAGFGVAAYGDATTGINQRNKDALPFLRVPGDTMLIISCVAPVGGTPAGTADFTIDGDCQYDS
jgi:hypothetical protein